MDNLCGPDLRTSACVIIPVPLERPARDGVGPTNCGMINSLFGVDGWVNVGLGT